MPERWFFLPIKDGNVRVTSFFGLMEPRPMRQRAPSPAR
jgi:hypothetical protein